MSSHQVAYFGVRYRYFQDRSNESTAQNFFDPTGAVVAGNLVNVQTARWVVCEDEKMLRDFSNQLASHIHEIVWEHLRKAQNSGSKIVPIYVKRSLPQITKDAQDNVNNKTIARIDRQICQRRSPFLENLFASIILDWNKVDSVLARVSSPMVHLSLFKYI